MIRTGRCLLLPVAAVLIASGCGGGSARNPFNAGTGGPRATSLVEVTNNNFLDMLAGDKIVLEIQNLIATSSWTIFPR